LENNRATPFEGLDGVVFVDGVGDAELGTGVGDGVVFVRYLLLMRLNFISAAVFSDRTAERLT